MCGTLLSRTTSRTRSRSSRSTWSLTAALCAQYSRSVAVAVTARRLDSSTVRWLWDVHVGLPFGCGWLLVMSTIPLSDSDVQQ